MWLNYLKITLRSFAGNKLFAFINVFGLAVGLASVILIGLYVIDELGYDRYHDNAERLFRISQDFYPVNGSKAMHLATNATPAAVLLKADFPEIEETARLWGGRMLLSHDDVAFYEDGIQFVDASFLDMFHFEWIAGNPSTALSQPLNIVLTESAARKFFGGTSPLGKTLKLENALPLNVSGVIRDLPANTHLKANAFASIELVLRKFGEKARTSWIENISFHTYVKLAPGTSIQALEQRFPDFIDRHVGENAHQWTGLSAMPVTAIHLHSTYQGEMKAPDSMATVITLITVACAILVIACFNFMNLATALSALRSREVGVRKSIGAERRQLVWQFLGEALGMTLLASLFAVMLVELLMPAFNGFSGKHLVFDLFGDGRNRAEMLILVLVVACGAGTYPAFYLSGFKPAIVLKSQINRNAGGLALRNLLVVLQFSISIILVIATVVVFLQTRFARERDSGFNSDHVVILSGPPSQGITTRWEALKTELLANPAINAATASNFVPGQENLNSFSVRTAGERQNLDVPLPFLFVDYDFFRTYNVPLLSGRTFSKDFANDSVELPAPGAAPGTGNRQVNGNFILNASAARAFGWSPEQALAKEFDIFRNGYTFRGRIVGVVADSDFESVRMLVKPMMFILTKPGIWVDQYPTLNSASLRINGNNLDATLAFIDRKWKEMIPEFPVTRSMLNDRLDALYQDDIRLGQLYGYFAIVAIVIASFGLFALATFNAQRRIKEIGIRKAMGGSVWSIMWLLTNDFSKLVLLSNLIAWPVAYYAMHQWLQNFAYRIDLTPLIFIGSGLIALCIAWVTVGGTAAKAASQKPVLALRYE